ncbi:ribonuclease E/G [Kineothrix sp. MB12-C1]|uniref:ribonuclease E/G n=1 Tax=Kineothrix sp. MB12-C1 TaxID=3070215 RepID=UPI0027D2DC39|nr:ribonuclease E/G [Kineothrix sp. MB12-C1]WMC92809.1 ribonuclease E/G [Kineothrix sp. MB12-C1]
MKDKKYIICKKNEQIMSLLLHGNRLISAHVEEDEGSLVGNIYIAKVRNISPAIQAAFVEIKPGQPCFLALSDARQPILTNRNYDGRVLSGDDIVVQINKDAAKTKQPMVTTNISLSGKYCVISSGRPGVSYSAKLSSKAKKRIEQALLPESPYLPEGFGAVIRTNAKDLEDYSPLLTEWKFLLDRLTEIIRTAASRTCYSLLHKDPADYLLRLRDAYTGAYEEIVTDDEDIYDDVMEYSRLHPDFSLPGVRLYEDELLPLSKLYAIDTKLKEALSKKVWLKSGGYLIIEPTEALTVIDVNTGKAASRRDNEATFFHMNIEAAEEIAHQLILRNLSGIIIIDFINMRLKENQLQLMSYLGNLLKKDAVKTSLVDMTALGLVEITRMKISKPLKEQIEESKWNL